MNKRTMLLVSSTMLLSSAFMSSAVSAVTYQTGVGVSFTFNPKLTLTLSSSNLVISNLAPGTSDNSNEISITVSTNAAYGYNLSATVGNSTTYNNTDLTHTSGSSAGKFSSIAFQSNPSNYTSSFTTDNTWGYSIDSGTKYNGLPLYSDTTNIATLKSTDTTPATGTDTVNFLIGAKASTTQPTGDYKNVINFKAVTNHVPINLLMAYESAGKTKQNGYYKMQDMNSSICNMVEVEDDELQVIDARDNKVYWIAKLKDGHCWMTQNLDLDLDSSRTYTNLDTDIGWDSSAGAYNAASWSPARSTYATNDTTWGPYDYTESESYDPGKLYWNSIATSNYYDNQTSSNGNSHYHLGNYYNWTAAVSMNDSSSYTANDTDVNRSICPSNWTLPKVTGNDISSFSFQYLFEKYGWNSTSGAITDPYIWDTIVKMFPSGYWSGSLRNVGNYGNYWSPSSTSGGGAVSAYLYYDGYVSSASVGSRGSGFPVRCIAR